MTRPMFGKLAQVFVLVTGLIGGTAHAGGITVTNNTDVNALLSVLLGGGTGGITVTGSSFDFQDNGSGAVSSGIYTTSGPNNYNLTGSGIVLSTGNASDESSGPVVQGNATLYDVPATAAQTALLSQVAPTSSDFNDVTQLTVTFTAGPNTSKVFFNGVFASAEYPDFVGSFIDGFGLFLNGTNIAFAGGQPVNIDSPYMVNTDYTHEPTGVNGDAYQETALQGLLVLPNGNPVITFSGDVTPGSTGNTLTFIIGDSNDSSYDTAIYLQGLGQSAPVVPEPSTIVLMGLGIVGLAGYTRRRRARA